MPGSRRLLPALAAVGAALTMVAATLAAPAAALPTDPPGIVVRGGMTQPVFSFADTIYR